MDPNENETVFILRKKSLQNLDIFIQLFQITFKHHNERFEILVLCTLHQQYNLYSCNHIVVIVILLNCFYKINL